MKYIVKAINDVVFHGGSFGQTVLCKVPFSHRTYLGTRRHSFHMVCRGGEEKRREEDEERRGKARRWRGVGVGVGVGGGRGGEG